MIGPVRAAAAGLLLLLVCSSRAFGAGTHQREVRTSEDFSEGEVEGLAIREAGSLVPGRSRTILKGFGRSVWSAIPTTGGDFLVSSSEPASLTLLDPKTSLSLPVYTDAKALSFTLTASGGRTYAGVLNSGAILRVDERLKVQPFVTLPAGSVWALACDPQGNLFAATGPKGTLYRIDPKGKVEPWFSSDEYNLLSIAFAEDGAVLVGGGERGNLYRVTGQGKSEILRHFTSGAEIRGIVVTPGKLYVAVNLKPTAKSESQKRSKKETGEEKGRQEASPKPSDDTDESARAQGAPEPAAAESPALVSEETEAAESGGAPEGCLYEIDADRRGELIASFHDEFLLALARESDGGLLAGTGPHGRLYRVDPASGERRTLYKLPQAHVMCLSLAKGRLALAGTGDSGTAVLSGPPTALGTWTSPFYDGGSYVHFGELSTHAEGLVRIFARSGMDPVPDAWWSPWTGPIVPPGGRCKCPPGRYLQLRVELQSGGVAPVLEDLEFFYGGLNHRPRIESLTIGSDEGTSEVSSKSPEKGSDSDKDAGSSQSSSSDAAGERKGKPEKEGGKRGEKKPPPPGTRRIQWTAVDADDDALVFRLDYRDTRLGPRAPWLPINKGEPTEENDYDWDTTNVPDGRYVLRLRASDEQSNPPESTLTAERISEPIEVDNTRPEIRFLVARDGVVSGTATDAGSYVASVSMSVDGGAWIPVAAADGLFDSKEEKFVFPVPRCAPGAHVIAVQAVDGHSNVGEAYVLVEVPPRGPTGGR